MLRKRNKFALWWAVSLKWELTTFRAPVRAPRNDGNKSDRMPVAGTHGVGVDVDVQDGGQLPSGSSAGAQKRRGSLVSAEKRRRVHVVHDLPARRRRRRQHGGFWSVSAPRQRQSEIHRWAARRHSARSSICEFTFSTMTTERYFKDFCFLSCTRVLLHALFLGKPLPSSLQGVRT